MDDKSGSEQKTPSITIFSEELRKCLDAAGLSDCGENDAWNYWYQRLMNAYNESVERQIMTEQAENAKLRELVRVFYHCTTSGVCDECPVNGGGAVHLMPDTICDTMHDRMRELGVEV